MSILTMRRESAFFSVADKPVVLDIPQASCHYGNMRLLRLFPGVLSAALSAALCLPAQAVVVAGANGGGNTTNNTTAEQMAVQLSLTSTAFYNNVLSYSDAGSVYLGWANTPDGPRAYLLSAMHISFSNTMLINAVSYSVSRQSIAGSDLALLTLTNVHGIMPSLPVVNLATTSPGVGAGVIMAGFGRDRVQAATTDANTSDAVTVTDGIGYTTTAQSIKRWGTNQTVRFNTAGQPAATGSVNIGGRATTVFVTDFDQPGSGQWLTSNEAQAVLGDSGGGVFGFDGTLQGIIVAVSGADVTDAAFGEKTYFANIATYKTEIDNTIGYTLVPEPSTMALVGFGAGAALMFALRRRR
jgi:hypothetical protein